MKKLLRITTRQVCKAGERIAEDYTKEELISHLRQNLQAQRYLIVFDDVWQKTFWEDMKHALPNKDKGSRIIITTRNFNVANFCSEHFWDHVQKLQTWSSEMAWQLFCKKAFQMDEFAGLCPQELKQLSREIISKCNGLPLVISTIAGLLSTKDRAEFEWRKVLNNLKLEYEKTDISETLYLSYLDLPYHLKLCFLYFGVFPEDFGIQASKLFRLWTAEGFVKEIENKAFQDVAEEYLNELIQRNLVLFEIQFGVERVCKVHDLMHDIILKSAGDLGFCQTLNGRKSSLGEKIRRLSIHDTTENIFERVRDSKIWYVSLLNIDKCTKSFITSLFKTFKLLKVLNFERVPLDNLPKEVGNLFHLKYLSLRDTMVKVLPKSIVKLQNLQTLDVVFSLVQELPVEVKKLRNLRHLLTGSFDEKIPYSLDTYCGVKIEEGIVGLEELQTLGHVEAYPGGVGFVKELQKLSKLRRLRISKVTKEMVNDLGVSLEKMNLLVELYLTSINEDEILDLTHISSTPPFLNYLRLNCRLQKLPNWMSELHNVQGLELNFSRSIDEPLKCLKGLPNLAYLRMYKTCKGEELHFEESGFQKLRELRLLKLEGLKVVKIDKGALPLLEKFWFGPFPLMKEMPSDIRHVTNLKSLRIFDMPREVVLSLQPDGGADYWKIQHLPSVTFHYNIGKGFNNHNYKLGSPKLLERLQGQAS